MTEIRLESGPLPEGHRQLPENPDLAERAEQILAQYPKVEELQDGEPPQGTQPKEGEQ